MCQAETQPNRKAGHTLATTLTGAVALITGASSGIGAATAQALAREGAAVALVARRKDRLERLAAEIRNQGGRSLVLETDVSDGAAAHRAVTQTVSGLGQLDIVINNAGVMLLGPAVGAPIGEWERMISLNLMGAMYIAHAAMPHLLAAAEQSARRVADLVNVSSVAGRIARSGSGVYNATKFGLGAFSESLRQEVTRRHVRVSLIEPGAVDTELPSHLRPEVRDQVMKVFEGIQRLEAEDIADLIRYVVTRPRHVAINEALVRPTEQER
jgi:NADP-dependent 3-hydroxy acid dehydrogenase YdfG